jgi:hypothetical protein
MDQKLVITKIEGINEVEPAMFEIVVSLEDGSRNDTADGCLCVSSSG